MKIESVTKMDRGLAYAEACFETFRVIDGACFGWADHMQRLNLGLHTFGIGLSEADQLMLHRHVIKAASEVAADTLVRLTVSGGDAEWGLINRAESPAVYLQIMPYRAVYEPVTLQLKRWPFPLQKRVAKFTADYAATLRALRGSESIHQLFEHDNRLISAATANLLLYRDGAWWTPVADDGVLPGVIRQQLIAAGVVQQAHCPVSWLDSCEAVALCSSGIFVQSVAAITDLNSYDTEHEAFAALSAVLAGKNGVPKELR